MNFFSPLIKLFWTKTRATAEGYIKCMPPHIGGPVVRTDGHVTIMSLPKFLGLIGYTNLLSNGAPLARFARGLRYELSALLYQWLVFLRNTVALSDLMFSSLS